MYHLEISNKLPLSSPLKGHKIIFTAVALYHPKILSALPDR